MWDKPNKNELFWVAIAVVATALIGAERGWKGVTWNIGITLLIWLLLRGVGRRRRP